MKNIFKISLIMTALCALVLLASCTNSKNNAASSPTPASLLIEPTTKPAQDAAEPAIEAENATPQTQLSNDIQLEARNDEALTLTTEDGDSTDIISSWSVTTLSDGKNLRGETIFSIRENIGTIEFTFHPDGTFTRTTKNGENTLEEIYVWDSIVGAFDANFIVIRTIEEQHISWTEDISFVEIWSLYDVTEENVSFYVLSQSGSTALVYDHIIITAVKAD